jgi:hypothetical protein
MAGFSTMYYRRQYGRRLEMGEICNSCGKSCGLPPFSEMPWGGLIDGKDYCAFCFIAKLIKEKRQEQIDQILKENNDFR